MSNKLVEEFLRERNREYIEPDDLFNYRSDNDAPGKYCTICDTALDEDDYGHCSYCDGDFCPDCDTTHKDSHGWGWICDECDVEEEELGE